ncbi:MAG: heavy-metal-associated domain-containing protein [Myxococcales bacterium]|nr:heavy-metal-associated domain-containing protein [Myxococcales bacterium]
MRHALARRITLLGTLLGAPAFSVLAPAPARAQAPDEANVVLAIEGMHCASCAVTVRVVLRRLEGVREATVDVEAKTARVSYDSTRVNPERMIRAIEEAGYHARVQP